VCCLLAIVGGTVVDASVWDVLAVAVPKQRAVQRERVDRSAPPCGTLCNGHISTALRLASILHCEECRLLGCGALWNLM
jgi:hypothetical protein